MAVDLAQILNNIHILFFLSQFARIHYQINTNHHHYSFYLTIDVTTNANNATVFIRQRVRVSATPSENEVYYYGKRLQRSQ